MDGKSELENRRPIRNGHKPMLAFVLVLAFMCLIFVIAINYLSTTPAGRDSGIFLNETGEVSDVFYLEITPAGWTFSIWLVIYIWQVLWMLYALVGLFRKNSDGEPLYTDPELQSIAFYLLYSLNLGCNFAWMLLFDRQFVGWCLIPMTLLPVTLCVCLVISHIRLMQHGNHMMKNGMRVDIWLTRILVQNGMASYATWTTVACLINLSMVLTYRAGLDQSLSSTIGLSLLMVVVTAWFILDLFVFERYTRYLVIPYLVVCFALAGSLAKNYDATKNNSIATVVLISASSLALVVKVIMLFYRHFTRPVFEDTVTNARENGNPSTRM